MANTFGYNPYPEFNVRGDSANGQTGSQTPQAVTNQIDQSKPNAGGNAYADILKYLNVGGQARTANYSPNVSPMQPTQPPMSGPQPIYNPQPTGPDYGWGPSNTPQPTGPRQTPTQPTPPIAGATPNQNIGGALKGAFGGGSGFQPQNADPSGGDKNAQTGRTNPGIPTTPPNNTTPNGTPPPGVSPDAFALANQWAKYPGYEWLAQNPNIAERYLQDALMFAGNGASNIVFADWLHNNAPNYPNPDYMKKAGYDTYLFASPEDAANGIMRKRNNQAPGTGDVPMNSDIWNRGAPVFDDKGNLIPPPGQQSSPATPQGGAPPPQGGTPPPPPATPPSGGGPGSGPLLPDPYNNPNEWKPGTPPTGQTAGTPPQWELIGGQNAGLDVNKLVEAVSGMYNPQFAQQRDDFRRSMNANAALTGDINSGGYQDVFGRGLQRLMSGQGEQMAGATENALNRASDIYKANLSASGQKYSIDAQTFAAQMQDATQRYGIQTNADLQKFIDAQDNQLKQYGIDKNDLLQRYQAELQLKGQMYSADRGVDSAALQAAASKAAANAQIRAAQMDANVRSQVAGNQYNLGLAQLGWDQYQHDNPAMLDILKLYAGMSPEQMALLGLTGNIPWQQYYGIKP